MVKKIVAVDLAIRTEEEGFRLYSNALAKSTHPLGREILTFLAGEELKHKEIIARITAKLAAGGAFDKSDITSDAFRGKTIFTEALKKPDAHLPGTQDDLGVLEEAVKFETDGVAFFADAAAQASNPEEKKFFETMAREESGHKRLLQSCIEYLEHPEIWFERDTKITLDGV